MGGCLVMIRMVDNRMGGRLGTVAPHYLRVVRTFGRWSYSKMMDGAWMIDWMCNDIYPFDLLGNRRFGRLGGKGFLNFWRGQERVHQLKH
jgi:hypothetical protein